MGASDHIEVLKGIGLVVQLNSHLNQCPCPAELHWVSTTRRMQYDSNGFVGWWDLIKRPSLVQQDDLLMLKDCFFLFRSFFPFDEETFLV